MSKSPMPLRVQGQICLLLLLAAASAVSAKKLVIFGDSISDNGNGTNPLVKSFFQGLGYQSVPDYPPAQQYKDGRWSDGPTWPEYLISLVDGFNLYDLAVGGSVTGSNTGTVGDFYPNNLQSNGLGRSRYNVIGLDGQIQKYFAENTDPVTSDDVFVVESGNNNVLGAVTGNITNIVNFARNAALDAPVENALAVVKQAIGVNLDTLYTKGARKIIVWGFVAIEQLPLVQLVNKWVNVLDYSFTRTSNDSTVQFGLKLQAAGDATIKAAVSEFQTKHTTDPPLVQFFDFASLQRTLKANASQLGFIDTTNPCVSGIVRTDYATSNQQSLGTLVTTFPGASATLMLSHDDTLQDKLNLDQYLIKTLLGPVNAARPNNTVDWLGSFGDNLYKLQDNSTHTNKLGHILGAVLTSLPIGQGGVNPYNFIPSCITSAGSHLYHDEVHPTTKQHKYISDAVYQQLQGAFFS